MPVHSCRGKDSERETEKRGRKIKINKIYTPYNEAEMQVWESLWDPNSYGRQTVKCIPPPYPELMQYASHLPVFSRELLITLSVEPKTRFGLEGRWYCRTKILRNTCLKAVEFLPFTCKSYSLFKSYLTEWLHRLLFFFVLWRVMPPLFGFSSTKRARVLIG